MKLLLVLLFSLFSLNSFSSWVGGSKINIENKSFYINQSACVIHEKESCYKSDGDFIPGGLELKRINEDDRTKPIYTRREKVLSCANKSACEALLSGYCDPDFSTYTAYHDAGQGRVYCSKFLGYEQRLSSDLHLVKHSINHATKVVDRDTKEALNIALNAIRKKRMIGQGIVDLMIYRSASKALTATQRKQVLEAYALIKGLLETGNLEQAKTEIQAITPDGTLVTSDDKTALISEIDKHLN